MNSNERRQQREKPPGATPPLHHHNSSGGGRRSLRERRRLSLQQQRQQRYQLLPATTTTNGEREKEKKKKGWFGGIFGVALLGEELLLSSCFFLAQEDIDVTPVSEGIGLFDYSYLWTVEELDGAVKYTIYAKGRRRRTVKKRRVLWSGFKWCLTIINNLPLWIPNACALMEPSTTHFVIYPSSGKNVKRSSSHSLY